MKKYIILLRLNYRVAIDAILSALLGAVCLMLYVRTLARGLLNGDYAEFQTITYTLGIGHPTGYPVYVLIGKIFTFLPFGEIAYRVNFFSAFSTAFAVSLIYLIIRQFDVSRPPAVFGALMFALIPQVWKFASMAEVYAPAAACFAFILFCILKWKETNQSFWVVLAGTAGGLSLGIHSTIAFAAAPAILLYLILATRSEDRQKKSQTVKYAALGALLGVCLFFLSFLYIDHRNSPTGYYATVVVPSLSAWGMTTADFDSPLERLAYLYFPPQFTGKFFAASRAVVDLRLKDLVGGYGLLLICGLLGTLSFFIPNRKDAIARDEAALLLLALSVSATFAITYDVYDYYVFYYPSFLVLAIFAGIGMDGIVASALTYIKSPRFAVWISGAVCIVVLTTAFYNNISYAWRERMPPALNKSDKYSFQFPDDYKSRSEKIEALLEDDAIVFTNWSRLYSLYYVVVVLHGRLDVNIHQTYPGEGQNADAVTDYIDANVDKRPIYFTAYPSQFIDQYSIFPLSSNLFQIKRK